jgi:hypothetical protein
VTRAIDRFRVECSLAPHVDQAWAESFILELRLLEVDGPHIGAALSEVESHCAESGEGAQQAFGGADEYARNLGLPVVDEDSPGALVRWLGPDLVQVVGSLLIIWSFDAWLPGRPLDITAWHLVGIATCLLGSVVVHRFVDPILRGVIRAPKRTGLALGLFFMTTVATSVAAFRLMDEVIWRVPAGWGLTVGAAVMAAGLWWTFTMRSRDDLITSPLEHTDSTASGDEPGRLTRLLESGSLGTLIVMTMIPVGTVFSLAATLVLYQISPR